MTLNAAKKRSRMPKKKVSGKHKTPRQPMQIPIEWVVVARKAAAKRKQPVMWYLLSLIGEDAIKDDIKPPKYPWEEIN